jgi:valyl-tRNA synthetase
LSDEEVIYEEQENCINLSLKYKIERVGEELTIATTRPETIFLILRFVLIQMTNVLLI